MTAPAPRLSPEEYARSRHGVWLSAAALITDGLGRVLLVEPTYRHDGCWTLPGGGVEAGESPRQGCEREVNEELGLRLRAGALLADSWIGPAHEEAPRGVRFPGDMMAVFDGGVLHEAEAAAIRVPPDEIARWGFFDSARAAARMSPVDGRIMLAALRCRLAGSGTAYLEDGRHPGTPPVLDRHGVHVRPRAERHRAWRPASDGAATAPGGRPVREANAWLFVPDGRVVVVVDGRAGTSGRLPELPGTTVDPGDRAHPTLLAGQAAAAAGMGLALGGAEPAVLGWSYGEAQNGEGHGSGEAHGGREARGSEEPGGGGEGGGGGGARLCLAAPVARVHPATGSAAPVPARGLLRLLASPARAAELLGWGDRGRAQAAEAARLAAARWGVPPAPPGPVVEVPGSEETPW